MAAMRSRSRVPIGLIATLSILLAVAGPVAAVPRGDAREARPVVATHVDPADCDDITLDAGLH